MALALAPLTLVQPIGVLPVPVAVVGSALAARRRPSRPQVVGALLGVAGVAGLAVILLAPAGRVLVLPPWTLLAGVLLAAVAGSVVVIVAGRRWPALARCLLLSFVAAVLFGLNSIQLRMVGHLVATGGLPTQLPLLLTAVLGVALVLVVGLWAMQSAYTVGSAQVVICCLTLVDPITAVVGGYLLLNDGVTLSGLSWVGALACTALAAVGVVLLSREAQVTTTVPADRQPSLSAALAPVAGPARSVRSAECGSVTPRGRSSPRRDPGALTGPLAAVRPDGRARYRRCPHIRASGTQIVR